MEENCKIEKPRRNEGKIAAILTAINGIFFGSAPCVLIAPLLANSRDSTIPPLLVMAEIILSPVFLISQIAGAAVSKGRRRILNIIFLCANFLLFPAFIFFLEIMIG